MFFGSINISDVGNDSGKICFSHSSRLVALFVNEVQESLADLIKKGKFCRLSSPSILALGGFATFYALKFKPRNSLASSV